MLTQTHSPRARESGHAAKPAAGSNSRRASENLMFDPSAWQRILTNVRLNHPTLNRTWFDQMQPRL